LEVNLSMKRVMLSIMLLILIFIIFIFVPVKKAIKYEDIKLDESNYNIYMDVKVPYKFKKGSRYYWETRYDGEYVWVKFNNDLLQKKLNRYNMAKGTYVYPDGTWYDENNYIITGNIIEQLNLQDGDKVIVLDVIDWDIVYPINRRNTWKTKLLSNSYLTIYDYNWLECIKDLLNI